ncbi:MAG: LysR family transcriptional regulator [Gammaproteobacteria bacterium]|nr:MAG: LysR family transcriptional regulator [Gammaproteobacteria bacterium]
MLQTGIGESRVFDPARLNRTFRISLRDLFEVMVVPSLVARLRSTAPDVSLNVVRTPRQQIEHDLMSGRIDFAADAWFNPAPAIAHTKISEDHLVCLMRPEHPLGSDADWSLNGLLAWPHVLVSSRETGGGYEDVQLARHGLSRRVALRTPHYFSAALVVAQSDMILCAPARFARVLRRAVALVERPFPLTLPPLEVFLYWLKLHDTDPAHLWLREQMLDVLRMRLVAG